MTAIQLNVDDSIFAQALEYVKDFVFKHNKESKYLYIDDMGDIIEVENGKERVIPTKYDIEVLSESINAEDYISNDDAKKLLLNV